MIYLSFFFTQGILKSVLHIEVMCYYNWVKAAALSEHYKPLHDNESASDSALFYVYIFLKYRRKKKTKLRFSCMPIGQQRWPPLHLVGLDMFNFSSAIAIQNLTKLDRK